jgi:hypothetical protein
MSQSIAFLAANCLASFLLLNDIAVPPKGCDDSEISTVQAKRSMPDVIGISSYLSPGRLPISGASDEATTGCAWRKSG